jgi:hypothetical protein
MRLKLVGDSNEPDAYRLVDAATGETVEGVKRIDVFFEPGEPHMTTIDFIGLELAVKGRDRPPGEATSGLERAQEPTLLRVGLGRRLR